MAEEEAVKGLGKSFKYQTIEKSFCLGLEKLINF